jgi:hypothetical protein
MEGLTPHPAVATGASSERERGPRKLAHLYLTPSDVLMCDVFARNASVCRLLVKVH